MTQDNLRHAQYGNDGIQVDDPQALNQLSYSEITSTNAVVSRNGTNLKRGFPILRCPPTLTAVPGNGSGGGGGAAPTYQIVRRYNRNALEITFNAHTNVQTVFWTIASRKYSDRLNVVFEIEDASKWNGGFIGFQYSKDGNFTDNVRYTYNIARSTGWSGVHCLSPVPAEFAGTGTSAVPFTAKVTTDDMTYASFRCQRSVAPVGTTRIWLYEVGESESQSLPQIVIGADDGAMTWYTDGIPLCEKYGFSSYLAYIKDGQDGITRMRDSVEWRDAIVRGHKAYVHGCKAGINNLSEYIAYPGDPTAEAKILADIVYNRDGMVEAGLDPLEEGRQIYVLPQGIHQPENTAGDPTIINAVRKAGMIAARRAIVEGSILMNGGQAGQTCYLPIIGHSFAGAGEAANIAALILAIQTEIAAGRSVILLFHEVRAVPTLPEQITAANLELILAACAALVRSGAAQAGTLYTLVRAILSYTSPVHI